MSRRARVRHVSALRYAHPVSAPSACRVVPTAAAAAGAYDLSGQGTIGRASASSSSVPQFSIGTADRFAYMGQYVSKKHARSSSYFGRQSPGPATYNTRGGTNKKGLVQELPAYSFGGDVNRPSPFRAGVSPGPIYYPQMGSSSSKARDTKRSYHAPASFSMGSGHELGDATTVISPGPVYDTRQIPGQGDATKAGLPTFKFGTSKSRTDYSGQGKLPGPGEYGTPNMSSSSSKARDTKRSYHAPPKFTMYESYSWRTKGKKAAPAKSESPAHDMMHESLVKEKRNHPSPCPVVAFAQEGRWEED